MKKQLVIYIALFLVIIGYKSYGQYNTEIKKDLVIENQEIVGCPCPHYEAIRSIVIKPNTTILPTFGSAIFKISPSATPTVNFSNEENYIYTRTFLSEIQNPNQINQFNMIENITYFDGLGRPVQKNSMANSPSKKDIITHIEYDDLGRQSQNFLPYALNSNTNGFYIAKSTSRDNVSKQYGASPFPENIGFERTNNPFSYKSFEASPLSRVLKYSAPGNDWAMGSGHEIKMDHQTNSAVDDVKKYKARFDTSGNVILVRNNSYDAGELIKTVTKDENWTVSDDKIRTSEEYKDKEGRIVLKRAFSQETLNGVNTIFTHDTDYVYDDYGNLSFVIPPLVERTTLIGQDYGSIGGCNYYYDNFTKSIGASEFRIPNSTAPGGGSITISISNNILKIKGSVSFDSNVLRPYLDIALETKVTNADSNYITIPKKLPNYDWRTLNLQGASAKILNGIFSFTGGTGKSFSIDQTYTLGGCGGGGIIIGNQAVLDNFCYQYKYDDRNRLIEKKLPGKDWEYIVYDKLDRVVLTQDANLRTGNKWLFTKYDAFNRPVYTGEYTDVVNVTRSAIQTQVEASTTLSETKQATNKQINGTMVYYDNVAFPNIDNANINLFTINYYDNYNFDLNGATAAASYGITPSTAVKSLATGNKIRVLGTNNWITNVIYYDDKGRPICNYAKNDYLATTSMVKTKLDFIGKTLETTSTHTRAGVTTTVVDAFEYDHANRLLTQKQKINTQAEEVIVSNIYDELGQLMTKEVGGKTTQNRLQTLDYKYNIRGWLKNINDVNNIGTDLFAFQLNYNDIADESKKLYNGNISQTIWKTQNTDSTLKNYVYSYDALNRLTNAQDNLNYFNESLSYDKNGNILTLNRKGDIVDAPSIYTPAHFGTMDDLTYTYDGNKLNTVSDAAHDTKGFKDDQVGAAADTSIDYTYDANGNMITDNNKGIIAIVYNHLNLPTQVTLTGGTIQYVYDATGVKQRKIAASITTDYAGGFQYENNVLKFFPHAEGYAENNSGNFSYIYQYKDHLGNIRLSYQDKNNDGLVNSGDIVEENNYYPFGLKHNGYNNTLNGSSSYKYKYNGKELQDELGLNFYDYQARNYDPAIGKWMNIDPLAEVSRRWSPYNYAYNNPVINVDPDGMLSEKVIKDIWDKSDSDKETKWTFNENGTASGSNGAKTNTADEGEEGSSEWSPLTSSIFNNYIQSKYGIPDNQLGDFAGKKFEQAFITFGEENFEEEANFQGVSGRSTLSIPDAYSDAQHINFSRLRIVRYKKSVWWEVKARNKNVSLDKQIKGFIDGLHNEFRDSAAKTGAAFLGIVTTSNSGISPEVYVYAKSQGVAIQHWQAQYKMVNGSMHIDFGYKNSPITPPVYQFKTPVKL
jgi:RHS repeat-associated protein